EYLTELGQTRPSVVLAFAPKAAGTYLRSACVAATQGALVRTVHAQGGRDATFYLPAFLNYFAHGFPARTLVTHVHMQALPANRFLIEALDLKPVVMLRSIPDMLASYWDMLDGDHLSPDNWINLRVPPHFAAMPDGEKGDFLIQMVAPWYVSYFSTWLTYAREAPGRVLVLDYDSFRADPAATLQSILEHSRLPQPRDACAGALEAVWEDRAAFRYNQGVSGRGHARFSVLQIARLKRQLAFYPDLAPMADRLIPSL
ncbi:MAG TPA: sulfotransferase domain-containing protein, partial [Rhizomicrobium sp.]|nr:sulfotransferase domain-containing protein [Rhizomicrobium sp.]